MKLSKQLQSQLFNIRNYDGNHSNSTFDLWQFSTSSSSSSSSSSSTYTRLLCFFSFISFIFFSTTVDFVSGKYISFWLWGRPLFMGRPDDWIRFSAGKYISLFALFQPFEFNNNYYHIFKWLIWLMCLIRAGKLSFKRTPPTSHRPSSSPPVGGQLRSWRLWT